MLRNGGKSDAAPRDGRQVESQDGAVRCALRAIGAGLGPGVLTIGRAEIGVGEYEGFGGIKGRQARKSASSVSGSASLRFTANTET